MLAHRHAEQRREQLVGVLDLGDLVLPLRWNVAAATMRIAALMNRANDSAIVESMKANLTASRFPSAVSSYLRVCTIDECR